MRTRTGDLLVQQIRHFDVNGNEKTKEEWDKLISSWKGPIDTTFALGSGWSPWSQQYLQPGDRVRSPGLRNYMQLQVRFTSQDRLQAASISSIEVELAPPVAVPSLPKYGPRRPRSASWTRSTCICARYS